MSEADLMRAIQLEFSREQTRLFRNNVGVLQDIRGKYVKFGLAIGSSDLIGWQTVTIMPKDVGNELAVFLAVEAKLPEGIVTPAQRNFIHQVKESGGIAGVVRSIEDARALLLPYEC